MGNGSRSGESRWGWLLWSPGLVLTSPVALGCWFHGGLGLSLRSGPRLTRIALQAAEGLYRDTGATCRDHRGFLAYAVGEQLYHRSHADQAARDGPGEWVLGGCMLWEDNSTTVVVLTKLCEMGWGDRGRDGTKTGLTAGAICSTGEVSPVLAGRALRPLPVLRGGPHGGIQHASVYPPGVQGHRCPGECGDRLLGGARAAPASKVCLTIPLVVWRELPWLVEEAKAWKSE